MHGTMKIMRPVLRREEVEFFSVSTVYGKVWSTCLGLRHHL